MSGYPQRSEMARLAAERRAARADLDARTLAAIDALGEACCAEVCLKLRMPRLKARTVLERLTRDGVLVTRREPGSSGQGRLLWRRTSDRSAR